jgi:hypothetical protein
LKVQFRLRTLLVAVAFAALLLGFFVEAVRGEMSWVVDLGWGPSRVFLQASVPIWMVLALLRIRLRGWQADAIAYRRHTGIVVVLLMLDLLAIILVAICLLGIGT